METKENLAKGGYAQKIEEAFMPLRTMTPEPGRLEIFGVTVPIVQAIFLSESRVLVVPRFTVEPSVPPVFEFERNDHKKSYYKRVSDDVEHLLRHSETRGLTLPSS
jgi:hypothetical protein